MLYAVQRPFRVYPSMEPYDDVPLPPDWRESTEWVFARLMYPQHPNAHFGRWGRRFGGGMPDWREGFTSWTQDYPRADRHFAQAIRRLTRIHARSVEHDLEFEPGDMDAEAGMRRRAEPFHRQAVRPTTQRRAYQCLAH